MLRLRRELLTVLAAVALMVALPLGLRGQSAQTLQASYDDNDQLIKVVDPNGDVTTYTYDAIGNMLSITTSTGPGGSALAIFNFTPEQGGVDASVTIQGQNFSATPTADVVKFNGTVATVTAATTSSLTVTVPSGATTGPISVTVGSATATTTNNFTVLQNPVITSVNPTSALQGGTVTNFQVTGLNLTGSTFSFVPAFIPAAIVASNVTITGGGTSATMTLTLASSAVGAFSIVATTGAGSSSQIAGPNNTITVLSTNPSADADGDGLTNLYEEAIGSNPLNPSTAGDGIPDGWALFFGLNPSDPTGGGKIAPNGLTYLQSYQQGLNPLVPTLVPPTVSNVFPANGTTNYPTNGVVVVRFSEPLETPVTITAAQNAIAAGLPSGSNFSGTNSAFAAQVLQAYLLRTCCGGTAAVPGTIQLFQGSLAIGGTVILSYDGLSLVFAPSQPLSSSTTYTVVAQGVRAASGIQMTQVFQSTFTTGLTTSSTSGSATLTSPPSGATGVPTNAAFMVQFSQQVDPATVTPQTFYLIDSVTGKTAPGILQVDPSGFTASFVPSTPYNAGRVYYVYLTSGILDITQNPFSGAFFDFTTGFGPQTTGPQLLGVSPVNSETGVPLNSLVVAQFNEPISGISATTGLQLQQGGTPLAGAIALSNGNTLVTFTPIAPLSASTVYTIAVTNQITDVSENQLTNPTTATFTTGATSDSTTPSVTLVDPPNNTFGVGLNVTPHLTFNEPIDQLTIPTALALYYPEDSGPNLVIPATVTVSADLLHATLTPSAPLSPNSYYYLYLCGYTNLAGRQGSCFESTFYTGTNAVTNPVTVTSIDPSNAQSGVPLNAQITAVMSNSIDPTTISTNSITVTPSGGSAITGTVSLASDGVTLTFVPAAALTASTVYDVSVGGFTDIDGNAVTPFTSTFTTGVTIYGGGSFSLVSTSPVSGATGVSVTSPVTFNMTNLINPASVNTRTVEVYVYATGELVAGTYSVSGTSVTFTPQTQYPGSTQMGMYIYGLTDEAGNAAYNGAGSFTTANTVDHTPPTVTISPANGAQNVGLNTQIVLSFSKSINPATITANTFALFNGDTALGFNYTISPDNRTVVANYNGSTLPAGATITIELTSGIQDLSGNSLANTASQFTLTAQLSGSAPYVVEMRPGNGATNVPASTVVTLFTNTAMNPATVPGALHVTDNGVVISGSVQLFSNAQAIEFTPSAAFNPGDLIQVFLGPSALSADGVALSSFSGQFTVAGSPTNTTATVQAVNPFPSSTNVPLNTVIQIEYNQPLLASTINNTNVVLYQYSTGTFLTPTLSLSGNGQIINIAPTSNLVAGSQYFAYVSYGGNVTNIDGVNVQPFEVNFTAGTATDTVAPTIVSEAPPNNSTNIGTNAGVAVSFNKAINPISVTGSTIDLTAGSTTEVPSSISFNSNYTRVSIIPQAPLPPSTQMTVAINGVTSEAGVAVSATTTNFTTAAQPNFTAPYVVSSSVQSGQTNVPVNSVFSLQFSEPMDIGSFVNNTDVGLYNYNIGQYIPATVSWSADQTTIFFVPTSPLEVGDEYELFSYYLTDLSGNPQQNFAINFFASFSSNTNPPTVINTSPENTETAVPVNAPVQILFSEPIQPTSIGQITVTTGGNPVAVTASFSDANQLLTLTPTLPLLASNTTYKITITGIEDTAGNKMTGTVTNTFQTGPTFNLIHPQVTLSDPPNGATGVGTNVAPRIVFTERLNPLSVISSSNETYNRGSVELYTYATNQYVPATVGMSADRLTATITPSSALLPNTSYYLFIGYGANYYDVAGNYGFGYQSSFVTGSGSDTTHATVSTISPVNAQTGVPLNAQIIAVISDTVDPTTVTNTSITVTPSGGSAIAGTVSLASDGVTLTFVPSAPLTASKLYNVSVSGLKDLEGNTVTTFTSSFTTGATTYGNGSFSLVSTSPVSGTTGVSVTSPVTFNMTNLINPASVNTQSVEVYVYATNQYVAGTFSVSGASVTFTPLTQYPANTQMGMYIYGLTDLAGNAAYNSAGTFTTANTVDHTAPTVTISPANGTTNVGLNSQVVLTFSKSINPATITYSSVNLLNGDVPINPAVSISRDNRTVVLNYNNSTLPPGATFTVTATNLVTDLSGNALANTTSQFTTTSAVSSATPYVISMRPGNGATVVPTNTVITLFTSAPMNSGTIAGALHVAQGGVIVSGTTNVGSNGQSIEFTPTSALSAGTTVQVFLDATAQDIYGNYLSSFSGQFTTAGSITNTAAVAQAVNPFPNATNVPLNTVIQIEYNQPLLVSTINNTNVVLYQYSTGTFLTPTLSLSGNGQIINIAPTSNLVAGSQYFAYVSYGGNVTNTDGVNVQAFEVNFTAGTATDTVAPTIVTVAPPNSAINIGTNADVAVTFSKALNPVSVTGSSIQLSGGSVTEVPSSISFTPDYTRTIIIPQAPLPASTQMAIAITGITSQAGVSVASQTTHFTTMAGADFVGPYVINPSVQNGQTVGTNAVFALQFDEPIDPGSVNPSGVTTDVFLYDYSLGYVATTISFSADLTTIFLKPNATLTAGHEFELCSYYATDLSGNPQQNYCLGNFFTGTGTDTTGPVVQQVSPPSGSTGVGINAPVQILFNEPIDGASLASVTLKQGSTVVPTTPSLYDGDQGIELLPLVPLAPSTVYTINVTGVLDITGNAQSSFTPTSFTTGTGTDLITPTVVSTVPTSGQSNVPDNVTLQAVFSQAMDPASFDLNNSFTLRDSLNNVVPATITFSADFKTVTLQPKSNLAGGGATYYFEIGYQAYLYDIGGNRLSYGYVQFTTQ